MIDRKAPRVALPQPENSALFMLRAALYETDLAERTRYLIATFCAIALEFGIDIFADAMDATAAKLLDSPHT